MEEQEKEVKVVVVMRMLNALETLFYPEILSIRAMHYMNKGSNLKPRSNPDKRGRSTEDGKKTAQDRIRTRGFLRHQPPGLTESERATQRAIQLLRKRSNQAK